MPFHGYVFGRMLAGIKWAAESLARVHAAGRSRSSTSRVNTE
jgi:hypothetical protein